MRLFLGLAPLVAFYLAESWYGLRAAVVVGMVLAGVELVWTRWTDGRWSRLAVLTAVLVGVLGGLSLASDDPRFVLLAPALGDLVFAALVVGMQLAGRNLVLVAVEEQDPDLDLHPLQRRYLDGLAWRFAANLVLHAAATVWSAGQPRETWLLVSGPVQYVMLGAQVAAEIAWARLVVLPRVEAAEAEEAARTRAQDG
jgi:intracellular septation protein A